MGRGLGGGDLKTLPTGATSKALHYSSISTEEGLLFFSSSFSHCIAFFMLVHMHKLVNANVCMAIRGNEDVLKNALIISVACERTRRCSCFRSNIGDLP